MAQGAAMRSGLDGLLLLSPPRTLEISICGTFVAVSLSMKILQSTGVWCRFSKQPHQCRSMPMGETANRSKQRADGRRLSGRSPRCARCSAASRRSPDPRQRDDCRRKRGRQGYRRAPAARSQCPARRPVRPRELRRDSARYRGIAIVRSTKAVSRAQSRSAKVSSKPRAAPAARRDRGNARVIAGEVAAGDRIERDRPGGRHRADSARRAHRVGHAP